MRTPVLTILWKWLNGLELGEQMSGNELLPIRSNNYELCIENYEYLSAESNTVRYGGLDDALGRIRRVSALMLFLHPCPQLLMYQLFCVSHNDEIPQDEGQRRKIINLNQNYDYVNRQLLTVILLIIRNRGLYNKQSKFHIVRKYIVGITGKVQANTIRQHYTNSVSELELSGDRWRCWLGIRLRTREAQVQIPGLDTTTPGLMKNNNKNRSGHGKSLDAKEEKIVTSSPPPLDARKS
ncbi:hypothetical protein WN51_09759 [Melipona quadrifasciata]|uniref:Uncharacterized protein n=1 Tax=Melipona quadrifasciata TaxID=166423 RepID=A0A0M9A548_9HYME|nr:hypothetical protein WN51_09759 [Melipona quadrifasciata]